MTNWKNLLKDDTKNAQLASNLQYIVERIGKAYDLLKKGLGVAGQYRTYDYYQARKSAVYLEPIRIFTKLQEKKLDDKPKQPEKPKQPKKGGQIERKERALRKIDEAEDN